jgi:hypothetical protein
MTYFTGFDVSFRRAANSSRAVPGVSVVSTTNTSSSLMMKTLLPFTVRPGGSVRMAA